MTHIEWDLLGPTGPRIRALSRAHRLVRYDIEAELPQLHCPTLVMHSVHDARQPFEEGRLLAAGIAGARLEPLESPNHTPLPGEPAYERVNRRILLAAAALAPFALPARAAAFPERPLHLIVPAAPGGIQDVHARRVVPRLSAEWGQPVVVENRPGASGTIALELVARAAPDGYTMVMAPSSMAIVPHLSKVGYDPLRNFAAVTRFTSGPYLLVAHPSAPFDSASGLADYARGQPGELKVAGFGNGSPAHLTALQLGKALGIPVTHIAYAGGAQQMTDLLNGQVPLLLDFATVLLPHLKAGKMKAIGMTGERRLAVLPEVQTFDEQGLQGLRVTAWQGVLVPAGAPPEVVHAPCGFVKALTDPELRAALSANGAEVGGDTPEQFSAFIQADHARRGKLIAETGMRLQ